MRQEEMLLGNGKGQDSSGITWNCGASVGWMPQAGCPNPSSPLALPQICSVSADGWLNLSGPLSNKEMA